MEIRSSIKLLNHDDSSFFLDRLDTRVNATILHYNDASEIKCTDEDHMLDDENYTSISHLKENTYERQKNKNISKIRPLPNDPTTAKELELLENLTLDRNYKKKVSHTMRTPARKNSWWESEKIKD